MILLWFRFCYYNVKRTSFGATIFSNKNCRYFFRTRIDQISFFHFLIFSFQPSAFAAHFFSIFLRKGITSVVSQFYFVYLQEEKLL